MAATPDPHTNPATEYLLTREVAELLRTPESTVRYWRHVRTGPPSVKVGRRVLYNRVAVLAWLDAQRASEPGPVPRPRTSDEVIAARVAGYGRQRPARPPR
ncbi:helix-turn-helix domain-containing protein [Quadrisphaera sp. INWT6]|nr:helix-turn-helix domain-containing protein [Quadrisphaera sp. INWT6]